VTPRELAFRLVTLIAYAVIVATSLILTALYAISVELADEVRASRRTHNRSAPGGVMPILKNRKVVPDYESTKLLRAKNAELAAHIGDDKRAIADLAEAEFYAGNASMPLLRRAS
jgi:hypothetical protein